MPSAEPRTFEAVVGGRDSGGRFTLATPLGTFVTLARDLGLLPGMRLLVQIAGSASAGAASLGATSLGAADRGWLPARVGDVAAGRGSAPDAGPVGSEASTLLASAPQLRLVLLRGAPAAAARLPPGWAVPAMSAAGPAPHKAGATSLLVPDEAAVLAMLARAARVLAEGQAEPRRARADSAYTSPPEGELISPSVLGGIASPKGRTPAARPATAARGLSVAPGPGVAPDVGRVPATAAPPVPADLSRGRTVHTLAADAPSAVEPVRGASRSDAAGVTAPLLEAPLPRAEKPEPSGLHAVLERGQRHKARRAEGDQPGHVVIAVELGCLGTVEVHLHWTDLDLLVALAAARELPAELRADLATALGRWSAEPPADASDGGAGESLGR